MEGSGPAQRVSARRCRMRFSITWPTCRSRHSSRRCAKRTRRSVSPASRRPAGAGAAATPTSASSPISSGTHHTKRSLPARSCTPSGWWRLTLDRPTPATTAPTRVPWRDSTPPRLADLDAADGLLAKTDGATPPPWAGLVRMLCRYDTDGLLTASRAGDERAALASYFGVLAAKLNPSTPWLRELADAARAPESGLPADFGPDRPAATPLAAASRSGRWCWRKI